MASAADGRGNPAGDVESQPLLSEKGKPPKPPCSGSPTQPLSCLLVAAVVVFALASIILGTVVIIGLTGDRTGAPPAHDPEPEPADVDLLPFTPPEPYTVPERPEQVEISTTTMTWTNVDVAPDGSSIVFDYLGDLYEVSIDGGTATPIREAFAYDTQPRYAPDGQSILFKSDEGGCDNIWRLDLTTGEATPLTTEPYRFIGNAHWHPDGRRFVAVKWHTTTRSIPAGEIWTFVLDDDPTKPVVNSTRLVGRPSSSTQIGPEEPFYSSDGAYVYYSQNVADGATGVFEYSKDPHSGIYSIYRVNVATGAVAYVTGGVGGAARPTVSHGGSLLAFVRRTRFTDSLVLRDLLSGNERILYANLSKDQQEASAPSGVYPQFAFTPDDSAIVIWLRGQLYKIQVDTGSAAPLTVSVTFRSAVLPTARANQDADTGTEFVTKVAQWPSPVPGSSWVLFTAVGATYLLDTASAATTRVTTASDVFEFGPSAAPTGRQFAQVVWSDTELARIEVVTLDENGRATGAAINVTDRRGRYANPRQGPDRPMLIDVQGARLVFARLAADSLSGPLDGADPGLYTVDLTVDGDGLITGVRSETLRLVASGSSATFTKDGRGLLVDGGSASRLVPLTSELNDGRSQVLVDAPYATSVVVAPSRRLVAFVELNRVYVAALPAEAAAPIVPTAASVAFASVPDRATLDARLVGPLGGDFLAWTDVPDEPLTLTWVHGPTFHQLDVEGALSACADKEGRAFASCAAAYDPTQQLAATVPTQVPTTLRLLLRNATVLPMTGPQTEEEILTNQCIVVQGTTIVSVEPCGTEPPEADQELDVAGGVVTPGFVDAHAHWSGTRRYYVQQSYEFVTNLAFGVTTMHNPSFDTLSGFADAELVRAGRKLGPRIHLTGTIVYGADGTSRCEINTDDDAMDRLQHLQAYGAWSVKSYQLPCRVGRGARSSRQRLLAAAHALNFSVVPEGGMAYGWNINQILDGHTTIEHALPIAPLYDDVKSLFAQRHTGYCPTLVVSFGGIYGEQYWYHEMNVWEQERLMRFHPNRPVEGASLRSHKAHYDDYHHVAVATTATELYRAGVKVSAGAHGQLHGLGFHWEMWMFAQGGMRPYEVLRTATRNAAEALGLGSGAGLKQLGVIAPGALADLVIWPPTASPLDDIRNTVRLSHVMVNGRLYIADTMAEDFPVRRPLPPGPVLDTPRVGSTSAAAMPAVSAAHVEL